jgi:hypothetical protein
VGYLFSKASKALMLYSVTVQLLGGLDELDISQDLPVPISVVEQGVGLPYLSLQSISQ